MEILENKAKNTDCQVAKMYRKFRHVPATSYMGVPPGISGKKSTRNIS